jgi:hypothetical protein
MTARESVFIKKAVPESSIGIHRIRRNNIDWTVELEGGMRRGDTVELPQHLLISGMGRGRRQRTLRKKLQKCPVKNPTRLSSNESIDWSRPSLEG